MNVEESPRVQASEKDGWQSDWSTITTAKSPSTRTDFEEGDLIGTEGPCESEALLRINLESKRRQTDARHRSDDGDGEEEDALMDKKEMEVLQASSKALEQCEEFIHRVWDAGWKVVHLNSLPKWLQENRFLIKGHRPQLNSFRSCLSSMFRIHTETGNIWTHLLGCVAFLGMTFYFLSRPSLEVQWQEKAVFSAFFIGAIMCLGFSTLFHTMFCHSEKVGRLFIKLDYCGIAFLTVGSFVPWLHYSFYCRNEPKIFYLVVIFTLGTACIVVSLFDKFNERRFRCLRIGIFVSLGLSGFIPATHCVITYGLYEAIQFASLGWLALMALLYLIGAFVYTSRIPERFWPGKFDIWFQSHQIWHVFVLAAAFVHYHGITEIARYRLTLGDCMEEE